MNWDFQRGFNSFLQEGKYFRISNRRENEKRRILLQQYHSRNYLYYISNNFVSPIYTFSLAGKIIVYTPSQGTFREKYFNHTIYKGKNADFWWKINISPSICYLMDRVFSIFWQKKYGSNPPEMDIKVVIPLPTL